MIIIESCIYIVKFLNLKIPPNVRPVDILGEKKANLQRIERTTNIHMYYNEDEAVSIILFVKLYFVDDFIID